MSLDTTAPVRVSRELRAQIRWWRRGHSELAWGSVIADAYTILLSVLVYGSMLATGLVRAGARISACRTEACLTARTATPILLLLAALAILTALARLVGPLVASRATAALVLAAPVDRRAWLLPQLVAGLVTVSGVAGVLVAVGAAVTGWPVAAAAVVAGALAVLLHSGALLAQVEPRSPWRRAPVVASLLTAAVLAAVALGLFAGVTPPDGPLTWSVAAAAVAAATVTTVRAWRRLTLIRRRDLVRGHSLTRGLAGAMAGLDPALAFDVVLARSAEERGSVRPRRGGLPGGWAPAGADLIRLRRHPGRALALLAALTAPYAAAVSGAGVFVVPLALLLGWLVALPLGAGMRVLGRSPSVGRLLGAHPARLRLAALVVPGAVLLCFGLACAPALPGADPMTRLACGAAVGIGSCAALARWHLASPPDYNRPLASTPMGAVPTNLYGSAVRGLDIVGLVSIPLLLSPDLTGAAVSLALSGVVLGVLVRRE
ncbi:DUF6297 family protein [Nocardioides insulae]|uniref:DUF6297 family protein n=1 Tax=Nocardioides insulae TaxID=394734 RepID=UPI00041274FE|nr:DUF6297 family protein [Nocardioides insulae]